MQVLLTQTAKTMLRTTMYATTALVLLTRVAFAQEVQLQSVPDDSVVVVSTARIGPVNYTPFDTTTVVRHATKPCSAKRLCPKGWDVAAIAIEAPGAYAPVGTTAGFRVTIANVGAKPAPAVPVAVTVGGTSAQVMAPEMASGDTVIMVVPLRVTDHTGGQPILLIDPQDLAGDVNAGNNKVAADDYFQLENPDLKIVSIEVKPEIIRFGKPTLMTVVVRNSARVAPLVNGTLHVTEHETGFISSVDRTFSAPTIPPQSEVTLALRFPPTTGPKGYNDHQQIWVTVSTADGRWRDATAIDPYFHD